MTLLRLLRTNYSQKLDVYYNIFFVHSFIYNIVVILVHCFHQFCNRYRDIHCHKKIFIDVTHLISIFNFYTQHIIEQSSHLNSPIYALHLVQVACKIRQFFRVKKFIDEVSCIK